MTDSPPPSPPPAPPPAATPTPDPSRDDSLGAIARRLGPASILAVLWLALPALLGFTLLANMAPIAEWFEPRPFWQQISAYVLVFIVSAGFGLLPTYAQALFGGYLFKTMLIGVPAALGGFVGASVIGYLLSRRVGRNRVQAELDRHPKARVVQRALVGRGFWPTLGIVTLVRIPPNSPFSLTNLVLATAGVPRRVYLIGTLMGMAPRTAVVVWLGTQIQDWSTQEKPGWFLFAAIGITIVVLVAISHIANKALERATKAQSEESATPPLSPPASPPVSQEDQKS